MPAWIAAPRATTSLTASELSGLAAAQFLQHAAGHRHVRQAADEQQAVDARPIDLRVPQHQLGCEPGADEQVGRQFLELGAQVNGTVSTLPAWLQMIVVCWSLLRVRLARSAAAARVASEMGSARGHRHTWPETVRRRDR